MTRLTFIVPFYNVESYIEECIRSLYNQNIPQSEYEVICVDDCSQDGSRAIVERLQNEYPTLKLLVHTENKRQGGARNTGLKVAQGEYMWFVDSDDQVIPNVLGNLLALAEKSELDMLQFNYVRSAEENGNANHDEIGEIQDGETYLFGDKSPKWSEKVIGPWLQLFRRQFLIDNHLIFIERIQYEDTDFVIHAFLKAKRVQYYPIDAYIYRENRCSTTLVVASPQKIAWKVNQVVRCMQLAEMSTTSNARKGIIEMVSNMFSAMRGEIKKFDVRNKYIYIKNLTTDIGVCKRYMSWRTWLAIRYGITWFI